MTFREELVLVIVDKLAIGFLIVVAGFFFNRLLEAFKGQQALRKEYETLRDQTTLKHLQRQIEELYSPLLGLIQYTHTVFKIARKEVDRPDQGEVWNYFVEKYFLPLNAQIATLLRTKIYLIESDEIPESFKQFLAHQAQFDSLHNLWKDKGIRSEGVSNEAWPPQFEQDVRTTLDQLRKRHNEYIRRLTG